MLLILDEIIHGAERSFYLRRLIQITYDTIKTTAFAVVFVQRLLAQTTVSNQTNIPSNRYQNVAITANILVPAISSSKFY